MALATPADYEEITGKTPTARAVRLLNIASASIVAASGQDIVQATSTDVLRSLDGHIRFPQRPVVDVVSVVVAGVTLVADVDYRWTPGGNGSHAYLIRRYRGRDVLWGNPFWDSTLPRCLDGDGPDLEVTVTNTHGWKPIPEQLVAAAVGMVDGVLRSPSNNVTSQTEIVGPFQLQQSFADPQGPEMSVPGPVRSLLDELCGVPGPTSMPIVRGP